MKIFKALGSGFCRAIHTWKGVLIIWIMFLMLVSIVALPMRGVLRSGFGSSMITEKFIDGFNLEAFSDLGASARSLVQFFSSGMVMLIFIGLILNAFLTGGLFSSLKLTSKKFQASEFFRTSAKYFWSFLVITLIIGTIIFMLSLFIVVLPVSIVAQSNAGTESAPYLTGLIAFIVFFMLTLVLILVADYARAWQAVQEKPACFRALGFGFSTTFKNFWSSYPMIVIIVALQAIFLVAMIKAIGYWKPVSGGGVFLLFLISQILFILRILLKTWRYGSVTALKELNDPETMDANQIIVRN